MSLGTALSNVRWAARRAEAEAWVRDAWAAGKRRLTVRWMPVVAAMVILAALALAGSLSWLAALGAVLALLLAASVWPLDASAFIGSLAGGEPVAAGSAAGRQGPRELVGRRRCHPDGGAGARCQRHAAASQSPRCGDVFQDPQRSADEPGDAQSRPARRRRPRAGYGGRAHRCGTHRARAGGTPRRRHRIAAHQSGRAASGRKCSSHSAI